MASTKAGRSPRRARAKTESGAHREGKTDIKTSWRLTARARLEADPSGAPGFLLDTYNAAISTCNDTAWTLLRMLKRGASIDRLTRELVARHRASHRMAQSDALNFVRRLRRMGLVDATP